MIHYSCDLCKRDLDPARDSRYVMQLEIAQAIDPLDVTEEEDDRDYLEEIQEVLQRCDDDDILAPLCDGSTQRKKFDLCADCCKRVMHNPLGRDQLSQFNFSPN